MAFCESCGAQMGDDVAFCPNCGKHAGTVGGRPAYGAAPAPAVSQAAPITAEQAKSFFSSLFDMSFSSFVTTKIIKVLFVLAIVGWAIYGVVLAGIGFQKDTASGLLILVIGAPIVFFLGVIYSRVFLEIVIVIFRMAEHLAEIAERGRRPT